MSNIDNSFSSLVAKLNEMSETDEKANKHKEIKVIKKAKQERKHNNPEVNAMANLLESIDETKSKKPNHLLGKEKTKSVPAGETDGTTENPSKGKLVGEADLDEDLIASLSNQFKDLLHPKEVAEEEPTPEAKPAYYKQTIISLEQLKKNCVRISTDIRMGGSTKAEHIERMFSEYEQAMAGATQQPTPEAVGEFAEPIYALCDELECPDNHPVFDDLVRYMSGDQINDFVDDFRRNHDMPAGGTDEGIAATIGQGIDSAVAGAGKMAVKGLKKGVKKLSRLGSKNTSTSFDGKGGSKTTTTYNEQDNESN
jgi:hypothetical protein